MLTRILDTTGIDVKDPEITAELNTDLRRMDCLKHLEAPKEAGHYRVKVTPSARTFAPGLHRFRFELTYGNLEGEKFVPIGEPILYQTETLPMI